MMFFLEPRERGRIGSKKWEMERSARIGETGVVIVPTCTSGEKMGVLMALR